MRNSSRNTILLLTAGSFFAFFVFGFTDNLKGPTLPALLQDLGLNYSNGGTILFGTYLGFLIATLVTGILADVVGKKAVILIAGLCLALGVGGYSSFHSAGLLTGAMLVLGLGLGALELGSNTIIVDLHTERKGRYLNLMSVFHGLGSMLAPLYAGSLLAANTSWRSVYRWDYVLITVLILFFFLVRYPRGSTAQSQRIDFKNLGKTAFTKQMGWFYFAIALYVATELGIASWLVEFLQKARALTVTQSTQSLSFFFALIMLGRFLGSFFIERIGYLSAILIASLGAAGCLALGLFGSAGMAFFLPLTGFFLSIIFPTITAAASELHQENISSILGFLFTFAGVGGMIGPWLIGVAGDAFGISLGFGLTLLYSSMITVSVYILLKRMRHAPTIP